MKKQSLKSIFVALIMIIIIINHKKINGYFNLFRAFEGKIISKDIGPRGFHCLELNDQYGCNHNITNVDLFNSIDTGDYIIKKRWSLHFTVIKNNKDTIKFQ